MAQLVDVVVERQRIAHLPKACERAGHALLVGDGRRAAASPRRGLIGHGDSVRRKTMYTA